MNSDMFSGMFNSNKLMERFFKKVDNVAWDLMTGRVGIVTADGIVSLEQSKDGDEDVFEVSVNMMDQFGMAIPAFAQNTPIDQVNVGDLIHGSRDLTGWVVGKKGKSFEILKPNGQRTNWQPPKVKLMGIDGSNGVMVLRSLMNMLPGGDSSLQGMQQMLMPMMMMGGENIDLDSMLPMMLMMQTGNQTVDTEGNANPMGGMNMQNMMMPMMMMSMMKDKGSNVGSSPFMKGNSHKGNFFDRGEKL